MKGIRKNSFFSLWKNTVFFFPQTDLMRTSEGHCRRHNGTYLWYLPMVRYKPCGTQIGNHNLRRCGAVCKRSCRRTSVLQTNKAGELATVNPEPRGSPPSVSQSEVPRASLPREAAPGFIPRTGGALVFWLGPN